MAQTRKQVRRQQQAVAEARNAEIRAAEARAARRKKALRTGGIVVAVAAVGAGVAVPLLLGHGSNASALPHPTPAARDALPPWPAPAHPLADAQTAGLRVNNTETLAEHFHAHLDVIVNGRPVAVPADIGIDTSSNTLSEMHTHDAGGVIHIEAPDAKHRYVLGQLFAEWDVRLDATHLGGLVAGNGKTLTAYVGGKQVSGNPAEIELKPHEEIALVYGPAGAKITVPKSYTFQQGE